MKHIDLFPVASRTLNLQATHVPREESTQPHWWALLLLANVRVGDDVVMDGSSMVVARIENDQVTVEWQGETLTLTDDNVRDSAPYEALVAWLTRYEASGEPYADPLALILERDPAVYRLRTGRGWVVNDRLMVMSGNISYPLQSSEKPDEPHEPDQSVPITTDEGGQGAFDF
jgi:hypothetical protein